MTIDTVINVESDEDNDREKDSTYLNRKVTLDEDDLFGKIVSNAEEAYQFYVSYATRIGFSVRRGKLRRDAKGVVIQINFLCYKEGFQMDSDPSETKQSDRLNTRTGCKAAIRFSLKDDVWKVTHFIAEHNHDLAKPEEREFLRSNRKISEAHKSVIKTMANAGIRTTNTYSYMAKEVGGSQNVGFTKKDCYNFVNMEKMAVFEAGDAQSLVNLFKEKQTEDPMFFYHTQVDEENRLTNFFWTDGRSRLDYECFGDVVIFDTTYRTNRYNMICAPFVGLVPRLQLRAALPPVPGGELRRRRGGEEAEDRQARAHLNRRQEAPRDQRLVDELPAPSQPSHQKDRSRARAVAAAASAPAGTRRIDHFFRKEAAEEAPIHRFRLRNQWKVCVHPNPNCDD